MVKTSIGPGGTAAGYLAARDAAQGLFVNFMCLLDVSSMVATLELDKAREVVVAKLKFDKKYFGKTFKAN
ncbi:hypothetical protein ACHAXR_001360 [Thalassiosira sp. AJA248-18]